MSRASIGIMQGRLEPAGRRTIPVFSAQIVAGGDSLARERPGSTILNGSMTIMVRP